MCLPSQYWKHLFHICLLSLQNVLVTYFGMFIGGDYIFEPYNFIGINISVGASIVYSFFKFKEQNSSPTPVTKPTTATIQDSTPKDRSNIV